MTVCWMGVLYDVPHDLGAMPGACLMCDAKQREDDAGNTRDLRREAYVSAEETVPEDAIACVPTLTEAQKETLRTLGKEGYLAVPLTGMTLDEAPFGERMWRFNFRVWTEPGFAPHMRFMRGKQ